MEDVRPRAAFTVNATSVTAFAVAGAISALIWYELGELLFYLL
ncbi:hypothetical protein ACETK8_07415 [Brevundimonas staleyi]|uniref:Uncharacterized protein n=1 Tax=Brevundimonas staleyi TaxID=74326 RepID=A0ABW0FQ68_9CAUL